MKLGRKYFLLGLALVAFVVIARVLPHPFNFTPVLASGLVATLYLDGKRGWLVPLAALLISDLVIGFYSLPIMLSVYGAFGLAAFLGNFIKKPGILSLGALSLSGSLLFFLVTNAAVWLFGAMYPPTVAGLASSYVAGIPFFKAAVVGDLVYTLSLSLVFEVALERNRVLARLSGLVPRFR